MSLTALILRGSGDDDVVATIVLIVLIVLGPVLMGLAWRAFDRRARK